MLLHPDSFLHFKDALCEMNTIVPSILPKTIKQWLDSGKEFKLLDIREAHEVSVSRLSAFHIPMAFCLSRQSEISREVPVILYCRSGARSAATVSALCSKHGFDNLHSLQGGITAWAKAFEPRMEIA
jgi:adenylyltransferase/sulfurtransferase